MWVLISFSFRKAVTFFFFFLYIYPLRFLYIYEELRCTLKTNKPKPTLCSRLRWHFLGCLKHGNTKAIWAGYHQRSIRRPDCLENTMIAHAVLWGKTPPTCLTMCRSCWIISYVSGVPAGQITVSGVKWVLRGWRSLLDNVRLDSVRGPEEASWAGSDYSADR